MKAIYSAGGELSLAITLKDEQAVEKSGRVYIDEFCEDRSIKLIKSSHVNNEEVINSIKQAGIDWLFIIGWSQIASKELLDTPKKGVLGIHPTLLPIGRGRAAIPWAILKGLESSGVTMFKLDEGVDTGPILSQIKIPLDERESATDLYKKVNRAHISLMEKAVPQLLSGEYKLSIQDESKATEWPGRKPEDGLIDLNGSVMNAEKLIRAVTHPYPGAFFIKGRKKVIVWSAEMTDEEPQNCIKFFDGTLKMTDFEVIKFEQ